MDKPLKGVRVIECGYFVAGPSAGMNLADWGADVVKIEPPFGDPAHRRDENGNITTRDEYFTIYNRGVRDIVINQKDKRGLEVTERLIANADVFLTSFRTGALKKMGLDWETLHAKYPKLIYAIVTGFGEEGPTAGDPGFDTVAFWCKSGITHDIVNKGDNVLVPPVAFGDLLTAAMIAGGIGTALYQREKTGKGQKVSVSLYSMGLYAMTYPMFTVQTGGSFPITRREPELPMMDTFKCKDGNWFFMANVDHEKHYNDLMRALGREDLVDDPRFASRTAAQKNIHEFIDTLDGEFAKFTRREAMDLCASVQIACTTINTIGDNIDDPQAVANDFVIPVHLRDGMDGKVPGTPVRYGDGKLGEAKLGPLMGEDTVDVMHEVGYSDEEIKQLEDDKVIAALQK
jgi:crotonobetainyl-CoA:carnitine CoA-transferase CaiB-like acyl-CoA transferase